MKYISVIKGETLHTIQVTELELAMLASDTGASNSEAFAERESCKLTDEIREVHRKLYSTLQEIHKGRRP